jgi:cytochrome c peroxidase
MKKITLLYCVGLLGVLASCQPETQTETEAPLANQAILETFETKINPNALPNYANQAVPNYIRKDNTGNNPITDEKATLGRVLFYDKNLSIDNTISCASCHKQALAFGDTTLASSGVQAGVTTRHSMRLINTRYAEEIKFFWDERAATLEAQVTDPIQDHAELGFSGQTGRPNFAALLTKLNGIAYYKELFQLAYGSPTVTEQRIQDALANFIRSIQSFDSKFDVGRTTAANDAAPFQNFTAQENLGKQLFLTPPVFNPNSVRISGGAGCQGCHRAPEFDIDPNTRNNGVVRRIAAGGPLDLTNTRSPSLRDVVNSTGGSNGPFMHNGVFATLQNVMGHYNTIPIVQGNNSLDARLMPGGIGQNLNLTPAETAALVAFVRTLSGRDVYTNEKWSDPFTR